MNSVQALASKRRVQILWIWKAKHLPKGEVRRWHFAAHGARYESDSAAEMAALLRSHGKQVKLLPLGKE